MSTKTKKRGEEMRYKTGFSKKNHNKTRLNHLFGLQNIKNHLLCKKEG